MIQTALPKEQIGPSCRSCARLVHTPLSKASQAALRAMECRLKEVTVEPGRLLFEEDEAPTYAYCLQGGLAKRWLSGEDGRVHVLGLAGEGAMLGGAHLLCGMPYPETVEAVTEVRACRIDEAALKTMVQVDVSLWEGLLRDVCRSLQRAQLDLLDRAHRSARAKLAGLLLDLHRAGAAGGGPLPFSRQDLGDMIGVTEETAIRLLAELRRKKVISLSGRRLKVLKPSKLVDRLGSGA